MSGNENPDPNGQGCFASQSPLLTGGLSAYIVVSAGNGPHERENPAIRPVEGEERRLLD